MATRRSSLQAGQGHRLIAQSLLERGIGVDVKDARGATPLLHAIQNGHVETVKLLLAWGATRDPRDDFGAGAEEYMQVLPDFYRAIMEDRAASRAYRPTDDIEALLAVLEERHAEIRLLLAAG